jgi:hypothetical protein
VAGRSVKLIHRATQGRRGLCYAFARVASCEADSPGDTRSPGSLPQHRSGSPVALCHRKRSFVASQGRNPKRPPVALCHRRPSFLCYMNRSRAPRRPKVAGVFVTRLHALLAVKLIHQATQGRRGLVRCCWHRSGCRLDNDLLGEEMASGHGVS